MTNKTSLIDNKLFLNENNTNDKKNNLTYEDNYSTSDTEESIYEQESEYDTVDENEGTFVGEESSNDLIDGYLKKSNSIQWDKDYGIKQVKSVYKIGNAKISFNDDELNISDTPCKITPGSMELLFMKSPDRKSITDIDEKNYSEIINKTNAHHKYHKSNMPIKNPASRKYIDFIAPYNNEHYVTGLLPTVMTVRKKNPSRVNYIYCDDPN